MYKSGDLNEPVPRVHLWLENRFRFDLGNFSLEVIHTPGHTSGSICLYELNHNVLFTGDTLFAGGSLSYIAESGSVGDYIYFISHLTTRKINKIYPGHGDISKKPEPDFLENIFTYILHSFISDFRHPSFLLYTWQKSGGGILPLI